MIHERGYWMDRKETDTHEFDASLAKAIVFWSYEYEGWFIDIGCGNGSYVRYLMDHNIEVVGYDGSPLTPELTGGLCKVMDFSVPQNIGKFRNVLSLEVGEHIPAQYEDIFIDNLCNASYENIILSWAVEGQPGIGHVNCRNNDYIEDKFRARGFEYIFWETANLREAATLPWFKNTIMVFRRMKNEN